jgi:hypothetical protein
MHGLLGVGPPMVVQEEPDCFGVSVSQEENLSVMLQSPHLQTNYFRTNNYSLKTSQYIIRYVHVSDCISILIHLSGTPRSGGVGERAPGVPLALVDEGELTHISTCC